MKSIFTAFLMITFAAFPGWAQDEENEVTYVKHRKTKYYRGEIKTLTGNGYHSGGFGAVSFRYSEFQDQSIVMAGFRGGWIINRTLAIGLEGHGLIPTAEFEELLPERDAVLLGGYGGLFLEPILFSNEVVHVTFPVAAGAGWLGFHDDWEDREPDNEEIIDDDVFWYVEPGAAIELNIARHFRVGLGVSRRFTQDLDLEFASASDFEKMNYFLTLKFGRF